MIDQPGTQKSFVYDFNRFNLYNILLAEEVYGYNFQSPGTTDLLDNIFKSHFLIFEKSFKSSLDIGFGCGGNSIYLNERFGSNVTGIDINDSFFEIARERISDKGLQNITLNKISILDFKKENYFDLAICRDVLMYIKDKNIALRNIFNSLKNAGVLVIIDYCRRKATISDDFSQHIKNGGYHLSTLNQYNELLKNIGFKDIYVKNITDGYITFSKKALEALDSKDLSMFETNDIDYVKKRTHNKINFCQEGSMIWGLIIARKA